MLTHLVQTASMETVLTCPAWLSGEASIHHADDSISLIRFIHG